MLLSEMTREYQGVLACSGDAEVQGLCYDSRKVKPGDLYFCLPGVRADGHDFAAQAKEKGACALVVQRKLDVDLPQVLVEDSRHAMSCLAQSFYGHPARSMIMVGITGTKGKTTSAYMIGAIARMAGHKVGLIGTVCTMIGEETYEATLTTPESVELQKLLADMRDKGCTLCVMEVSAHALAQKRLAGMHYDAALYTNLSQDHLDYFGDMDSYRRAKEEFFTPAYTDRAIVNMDDDSSVHMIDKGVPVTGFGVAVATDAAAREIEICENGVSYELDWKGLEVQLNLQLSGIFNVYNSMGAAVTCLELGMSFQAVKQGLESMRVVPGRIEALRTNTPYKVILDYAHSPAALENVLETVRQFTAGRLICVFGCGGGRDKEKRPIMGEIAGRLADYSILTSDNPRYEDPMEILEAIETGIAQRNSPYEIIENRREAIRHALEVAQKGDVIVLAGKGHETYQEVKGVKKPFDEKVVVFELLQEMGLD